jgi:hypothetical protein
MRRSRERMIAEILAKCPHYVDIVPPRDGYSLIIETEIFDFLDSRIGTMDLYGALTDEGRPFVRYCFLKAEDADAFREKFAPMCEITQFPSEKISPLDESRESIDRSATRRSK